MNICDYIRENDLPFKMVDGKMHQNGILDLDNKNITSLDGFVQNGILDLSKNQITSLDGFVQNGYLFLSGNQITSLNGFVQNGFLGLGIWQFNKMENGSLNIGCENKSIEEWDTFFDNGEEIQLKNDSELYLEIKKYFKIFYINN